MPYGIYDVNATPSDFQLIYPLYVKVEYNVASGDVYFSDRASESAISRLFASNVTLPSGSSLSQGKPPKGIFQLSYSLSVSAFSSRRLVLPDLASNPSPAYYLWRLVPTSYFGGGCDTLDVSMVDFYNQANFCSQPYGSCMNYQLSYWMKDTSTSTLPAVFSNFASLYGTVDGTKVRSKFLS